MYGSNKVIFFGLKIWPDPETCGKIPLKPFSDVFECPESKYEVHLVPIFSSWALANMQALPVHDCSKGQSETGSFFIFRVNLAVQACLGRIDETLGLIKQCASVL